MKLRSVRIQNFRSFEDTTIELDSYNCFVGPNGAGKSSVLSALNVLFRDSTNPTNVSSLSEEDFHLRRTDQPIEITATFVDLGDEAKEDLKAYVRQDELTITARAEWDADKGCADVKQYGSRMVMPQFAPFFESEGNGAYVAELRPIYNEIREEFDDLPKISTKKGMIAALRQFEESHPDLCEPTESGDEFYGWSKGSNRLMPHVQWVYIPAVKDASEEEVEGRATALSQLLERSIGARVNFEEPLSVLKKDLEARYREVLDDNRDALGELSKSIQGRLREWSHPGASVDVDWTYDPVKSLVVSAPVARVNLGEGPFLGELARLGHGLQRSFIVALLTEVAATQFDTQPTLILGFEEPELYQHPPQARHLAGVLEELAGDGGQVLVTTHSPYFVSGRGFESIRMTRKDPATSVSGVTQMTHGTLSDRLAAALQKEPAPATSVMATVQQIMQPSQNELFFSRLPILVEGIEDIAFLATQFQLRGDWKEFRRHGGHFIVCGGKTNLSRPLAIAEGLGIQPFVVFDADFNQNGTEEEKHRQDNACILRLAGYGKANPWPAEHLFEERLVMFSVHMERAIQEEMGNDEWSKAKNDAKAQMGIPGSLSKKNTMWISATVEHLWESGHRSSTLDQVCDAILSFGESLTSADSGGD